MSTFLVDCRTSMLLLFHVTLIEFILGRPHNDDDWASFLTKIFILQQCMFDLKLSDLKSVRFTIFMLIVWDAYAHSRTHANTFTYAHSYKTCILAYASPAQIKIVSYSFYTYTHIYIYTHTYIHIYIYIYIYIHTYIS